MIHDFQIHLSLMIPLTKPLSENLTVTGFVVSLIELRSALLCVYFSARVLQGGVGPAVRRGRSFASQPQVVNDRITFCAKVAGHFKRGKLLSSQQQIPI
jgi:hypothetical protein